MIDRAIKLQKRKVLAFMNKHALRKDLTRVYSGNKILLIVGLTLIDFRS
jgi:hypothetical protein